MDRQIAHLFVHPIALIAYALLILGALYFTYRSVNGVQNRSAGRVTPIFLTILFAMTLTAVGLDTLLLTLSFFVVRLWPVSGPGGNLGLVFLLILAGPIVFLLAGALCSLFVGARISRAFRARG